MLGHSFPTRRSSDLGDVKVAADAKLTGTPAFVINGYVLHGAQPISKFKRIAGYALANANKKP